MNIRANFMVLTALVLSLASLPVRVFAMPTEGHKILISAPSAYAVEVGRKVHQAGGNVVDVAVAVGLTLSVTSPYYAALGGGGFALVKMNTAKEPVQALDFREVAPSGTGRDYYVALPKEASMDGGHAVAVPGFPAGLEALHKKYGKLKWAALFAEPVKLARDGFNVSGEWVAKTKENLERFNSSGKQKFFKAQTTMLKPGEVLKQPAFAKALEAFRDQKSKGFYSGSVAADVVKSVQTAGGKLSLADMSGYKVRWLKPLTTNYSGHTIYLMPPPSSGGVVILSALKLIEKLNVVGTPLLSADELHLLAEAEKRAFRGRAMLGDPDFHKNPIQFLTSDSYLDEMRKSVNLKKTAALKPLLETDLPSTEKTETTHYSVMDQDGNAIALTVTLNGSYGSGVVSDKFGIAMNNEMDDFTTRPNEPNMYGLVQGPGNDVQAGKRPLSSMSPTLVEKDGKIVMSLGAPGGPRIITGVLQAIYRVLGRGMDVDAAVQAPRVHHQFLPDKLYVDKNRLSPEVLENLSGRGHTVEQGWMAKVYIVRLRPDGILEAAFDSRGEGAAGGY